jgi:hypothetical protein
MTLALEMGKDLDEVLGWPPGQFAEWVAYFNVQADRERARRRSRGLSG